MKVVLLLSLFVAFASALHMHIHNNGSGAFKPLHVKFPDDLVPGKVTTAQVCGNLIADAHINAFDFQIGRGSQVWKSGTINLPQQFVFAGATYCYDHDFIVPFHAAPQFDLYFSIKNSQTSLNTVHVVVDV